MKFPKLSDFSQFAYFHIDKFVTTVHADFVKAEFKVSLTADGKASVINIDRTYTPSIIQEQHRVQVFMAADENDTKFEKLVQKLTVDACMIGKGDLRSLIARIAVQSFFDSINTNFTCPFPENYHLISTNWTISDSLLPSLPMELKGRGFTDVYGIVKGEKKWTLLYSYELVVRAKK